MATGAAAVAQDELRVDITRGISEPIPIAVTDFFGAEGEAADYGRRMADVIRNNLARTALFELVDRDAFLQDAEDLLVRPRFEDWRLIDAQGLVSGSVELREDGRIRTEFRLWDVLAEDEMAAVAYMAQPENWRRIAHIISDAIYEQITGEEGYFDTRIVYVAERGSRVEREKRLAIMDQDGANHRYLTDGENLVLTPRFSPTRQEITYMAYVGGEPRVYLYDIETGEQEVLGDFPDMTFAPRFTPDGNSVLFSRAQQGNADIYVMDLRTREVEQLTDSPAIDTAPSMAPDGERLVFESDRGGSQQLYIMDGDGNVERLTFGDGRYATPVWSPRGDLIAFTRIYQGQFYIGVIRPDGTGERMLTSAYHAEGPTWAPNGRVLQFFKQEPPDTEGDRGPHLYTIDVTGRNERRVETPEDASDPSWSPPLHE